MRRWLIGALIITTVAGAGCSRSVACAPVENGVGVCLEGAPIGWSAGVMKPHMHEEGGYYAPVADLAKALGVDAQVAADRKSVTVGRTMVTAKAMEARGIHLHDERVYAPIREFAEAAGYRATVDGKRHTVNIVK